MIVLIAFHAKMCIFSNAIEFCRLRGYFRAILTDRCLRLLLLVGIYHVINDIDGQNLVIFIDDVLMLEHLWIFIFIIEVDGFKAIRARDGIIYEAIFAVAVRFTDSYFIHYACHLLLSVSDLGEAYIEDHSSIREFIAFLADLEDLVVFVKLISREE